MWAQAEGRRAGRGAAEHGAARARRRTGRAAPRACPTPRRRCPHPPQNCGNERRRAYPTGLRGRARGQARVSRGHTHGGAARDSFPGATRRRFAHAHSPGEPSRNELSAYLKASRTRFISLRKMNSLSTAGASHQSACPLTWQWTWSPPSHQSARTSSRSKRVYLMARKRAISERNDAGTGRTAVRVLGPEQIRQLEASKRPRPRQLSQPDCGVDISTRYRTSGSPALSRSSTSRLGSSRGENAPSGHLLLVVVRSHRKEELSRDVVVREGVAPPRGGCVLAHELHGQLSRIEFRRSEG